jgi:hypothetical protein
VCLELLEGHDWQNKTSKRSNQHDVRYTGEIAASAVTRTTYETVHRADLSYTACSLRSSAFGEWILLSFDKDRTRGETERKLLTCFSSWETVVF